MLSALIDASVRHRWLVAAMVALLATWGLFQATRLPIDAVPDITNVQVQVTTLIPALSPDQVEREVTYPVETALAGIPGLERTRSLSRNGFSQVTAIFRDGTDIYFARQQVAERLDEAGERLPEGARPAMAPITTGLGEVLVWSLGFERFDRARAVAGRPGWQPDGDFLTPEGERLRSEAERLTYLRTVQDWVVAPGMRGAAGIAGIDSIGGHVKAYVVQPDVAALSASGVSLADLVAALRRANDQTGAGFMERAGEAVIVRGDARASGVEDLRRAPVVNRGGRVVTVGDLARVSIGAEPRLGAATLGGRESVIGVALMLAGGNSRTAAHAAGERLETVGRSLPPGLTTEVLLDRGRLVDATIATVSRNLAEGALLVVAVLFVMLGNVRAALIAALMIPLAFLFAVTGMNRFGISGNLMSLGALDFGLLVDGAIVVIENTLRRMSARRGELDRPLRRDERLSLAGEAARQMVRPAAFGQLVILLVFAPLLLLEGVEGKTFQPMAATLMLALVGAFILSFTFVPAMTALLVREPPAGRPAEPPAARWLHRRLEPVIGWAVARPAQMLAAAGVALLVGLVGFGLLGREFAPTLDEGDIAVQAIRPASTGLEQSLAMQKRLETALMRLPQVRAVFARTGTAEAAVDPMPPNISDGVVLLKPRSEWPDPRLPKAELVEQVEAVAAAELGSAIEISQPIELRFNELISGVRTDFAVVIQGEDMAVLEALAADAAARLSRVPGAADVRAEQVSGLPVLTVSVDRTRAAAYGLGASDINEAVRIAVGGGEAGAIFEGDRRFDVLVRMGEDGRRDPAALEALPLVAPDGVVVPLSSVASLSFSEGPSQISRDNGSRRIVVQANVRGRDLGGFAAEAQAALVQMPLPPGVRLGWSGQFETLARAEQRLGLVIPLVVVLIGGLLMMALGSWRQAAMVFAGAPLAVVGGVLALLLRGMPFSISAAVGFIAVSGVATLNGLVLMQAIRARLAEGLPPAEAAWRGSGDRLTAVLTTALAAMLGFVPMALGPGAGAEVQKPLATVVIGGLITATALTLLALPAAAGRFLRGEAKSTAG
ncbi:MAG: efflux RND transporter permease subunit [Caulobacter sp.]